MSQVALVPGVSTPVDFERPKYPLMSAHDLQAVHIFRWREVGRILIEGWPNNIHMLMPQPGGNARRIEFAHPAVENNIGTGRKLHIAVVALAFTSDLQHASQLNGDPKRQVQGSRSERVELGKRIAYIEQPNDPNAPPVPFGPRVAEGSQGAPLKATMNSSLAQGYPEPPQAPGVFQPLGLPGWFSLEYRFNADRNATDMQIIGHVSLLSLIGAFGNPVEQQ